MPPFFPVETLDTKRCEGGHQNSSGRDRI